MVELVTAVSGMNRTSSRTRPAGPPPRPSIEPSTVRRTSATGVILVTRQKIALGRAPAGRTVTVHVAEHTLTIQTEGGPAPVTRTTTRPIRNLKANRPWSRKTSNVSQPTYRASTETAMSSIR
jgi:hypothetical protein